MSIEQTIEELERIAYEMHGATVTKRSNAYYSATPLIQQLNEVVDCDYSGNGYIKEKLSSLKGHFASFAELDDGNQHDIQQHYQSILADFTRLRGKMAFDLEDST